MSPVTLLWQWVTQIVTLKPICLPHVQGMWWIHPPGHRRVTHTSLLGWGSWVQCMISPVDFSRCDRSQWYQSIYLITPWLSLPRVLPVMSVPESSRPSLICVCTTVAQNTSFRVHTVNSDNRVKYVATDIMFISGSFMRVTLRKCILNGYIFESNYSTLLQCSVQVKIGASSHIAEFTAIFNLVLYQRF